MERLTKALDQAVAQQGAVQGELQKKVGTARYCPVLSSTGLVLPGTHGTASPSISVRAAPACRLTAQRSPAWVALRMRGIVCLAWRMMKYSR